MDTLEMMPSSDLRYLVVFITALKYHRQYRMIHMEGGVFRADPMRGITLLVGNIKLSRQRIRILWEISVLQVSSTKLYVRIENLTVWVLATSSSIVGFVLLMELCFFVCCGRASGRRSAAFKVLKRNFEVLIWRK